MDGRNEAVVRAAYEAYGRGDVARMLEFIDPALEWTYLNPEFENPEPETCHGRDQLRVALERQAGQGLTSQIEEIAASGDTVTGGHPHARYRPCARPPGRGPQFPCADARPGADRHDARVPGPR